MKTFILFILIFISVNATAQFNGEQPGEQEIEYCQIVGTERLLSSKVTIYVDYGQDRKFFKPADGLVKDEETGKARDFNGMIDALNWMNLYGWEFVSAYVLTISNQNVYHYLLKRKVKRQ